MVTFQSLRALSGSRFFRPPPINAQFNCDLVPVFGFSAASGIIIPKL